LGEQKEMTVKVIAEIGVNWSTFDEAVRMIIEAKEAGASYVKFQLFNEETIKHSLFDELQKRILDEEKVKTLKMVADTEKIGFILTPMYLGAVDLAAKYADMIKIRYKDYENASLLEKAEATGKPVLISRPYAIPNDFSPRIFSLYCIPRYPPEPEDFNLDRACSCKGFSSHYPHTLFDLAFAINRIYDDVFIEKHVMLPKSKWLAHVDYSAPPEGHEPEDIKMIYTAPPIDAAVSITFEELKDFIKQLQLLERMKRIRL
jgi:sialic acid synthase SpsE